VVTAVAGAVFLDRDGVLNAPVVRDGQPYSPSEVGDVTVLPGVRASIDAFREAGLMTVVVTNQPDIARGKVTVEAIAAINRFVAEATGVDLVVTCAHDDDDGELDGVRLDVAFDGIGMVLGHVFLERARRERGSAPRRRADYSGLRPHRVGRGGVNSFRIR